MGGKWAQKFEATVRNTKMKQRENLSWKLCWKAGPMNKDNSESGLAERRGLSGHWAGGHCGVQALF